MLNRDVTRLNITMDRKEVLILTLAAGSGHLQAAKSQASLYEADGFKTTEKKVLIDLLGKWASTPVRLAWNGSQKNGFTPLLFFFSASSHVFDYMARPLFFTSLLHLLRKNDFCEVVDTQPFGTKPFIKAIRLASWIKNRPIKYKKVLTDLPTDRCVHFFRPIRRLSKKDRAFIDVITSAPLCTTKKEEEAFWEKNTKLPLDHVIYAPYPLRTAFNKEKTTKPSSMEFSVHTGEGEKLLKEIISYSNHEVIFNKDNFTVEVKDSLISIVTLGTYPEKESLISYMQRYIAQKKLHCPVRKEILFILVGPKKTADDHYKSILKALKEERDYPKNLLIVPLSFQCDKALSTLYFNTDFIIAKSGGITSMELLKAVSGRIFIHDHERRQTSKIFALLTKRLFDTMPVWERGNALYLMKKKGAKLISPESFELATSEYFN